MKSDLMTDEIYRKYAKPVKLYVLSLCGNNDIADDVTSDTFLKAIKNIDRFKDGKILTWLCTIAKNTYFDYAAKKENSNLRLSDEIIGSIAGTDDTPEGKIIEKDSKIFLYSLLQSINAEAREVVYLRIFTDLSFKEIGFILGKSENWARVVFYRSKNKLKGLINYEK